LQNQYTKYFLNEANYISVPLYILYESEFFTDI
jgi:hypothetical protein